MFGCCWTFWALIALAFGGYYFLKQKRTEERKQRNKEKRYKAQKKHQESLDWAEENTKDAQVNYLNKCNIHV